MQLPCFADKETEAQSSQEGTELELTQAGRTAEPLHRLITW